MNPQSLFYPKHFNLVLGTLKLCALYNAIQTSEGSLISEPFSDADWQLNQNIQNLFWGSVLKLPSAISGLPIYSIVKHESL